MSGLVEWLVQDHYGPVMVVGYTLIELLLFGIAYASGGQRRLYEQGLGLVLKAMMLFGFALLLWAPFAAAEWHNRLLSKVDISEGARLWWAIGTGTTVMVAIVAGRVLRDCIEGARTQKPNVARPVAMSAVHGFKRRW